MRSGIAILKHVVREGLALMVTPMKSRGREGAHHTNIWAELCRQRNSCAKALRQQRAG